MSYYQKNKERCLEAQRRYRSKPEVRERYLQMARESSKRWYANPENRVKRRKMNKDWWQKEVKRREELLGRKQPSMCEICDTKSKVNFDHCHKTGKARGWICMNCNTVLGKVDDNTQLLKRFIKYLNDVK